MRALVWLHDRAIHLYAKHQSRRWWRRHHLTPEAHQRLRAAKRRTP